MLGYKGNKFKGKEELLVYLVLCNKWANLCLTLIKGERIEAVYNDIENKVLRNRENVGSIQFPLKNKLINQGMVCFLFIFHNSLRMTYFNN